MAKTTQSNGPSDADLSKKSVATIVGMLHPAQFWSALASLAILLAGAFSLGIWTQKTFLSSATDLSSTTEVPDPNDTTSDHTFVVCLDSYHKGFLYDADTLSETSTNADDITRMIDDLPITVVSDTTGPTWDGRQVHKLDPALIVIHASAFLDGHVIFGSDSTNEDKTRAYKEGDEAMQKLLRSYKDSKTQFIVYSRGFDTPESKQRELDKYLRPLPELRGRISLFHAKGSFRNVPVASELKSMIENILDV